MAEITMRRRGEMVRTLFQVLSEAPDGMPAKEAIKAVEQRMDLTEFELSTFPNNPEVVRFPKLLRFATIPSVKAGWLTKKSGVWTLTEEGLDALNRFTDPESLFQESVRLYREWEATRSSDAGGVDEDPAREKSLIAAGTLEEAEESAREAILGHLATISAYDFQDLIGKLLEAMGYHVIWIAPKGKDGGLDLLAQGDPLGVKGPRIKGQVKRRMESKTTEEELRAFLSLLEPGDVGVYIALGGYTRDAEALSRRTNRRITLIDGDALVELWSEHYDRIDEQGRQLLPIRAVHFLDADAVSV